VLSVGELAVHFGLEPMDVECLLDRCAQGVSGRELVEAIERLDCSPAEAERLALHLQAAVAQRDRPSHDVSRRGGGLGG
jgi:hypothetical protein